MKVLMVPVSDRPESKTALSVATELANRLQANVVGAHLRPHRDADKAYKTSGLPLFGNADSEWLSELGRKSTDSAARRAEKMFRSVAEEAGLTLVRNPRMNLAGAAIWQEKVGDPDKLMAINGPVADLTIVSRPSGSRNVARMFLNAALLHSGRPVMILPANQTRAPGKRVAIAWNQSAEVMRAVSACMPLLQEAEAVTVISCGPETRLGPKASQLIGYLKAYGVKAKVLTSRGRKEEQELLDAYKKSKSDLLVMGAYSRARFREVVFGGMTEYMLNTARIPVIMYHT